MCVTLPTRRMAIASASARPIPSRRYRSVSSAIWRSSSCATSSDRRRRTRRAHIRVAKEKTPIASGHGGFQEPADRPGDAFPVFRFHDELPAAFAGNRVELGLAVVLGRRPGRRDASFVLQAYERCVDSTFVQLQRVAADLFDAPGDAVPV